MTARDPDPLRVDPDGLADELGTWFAYNWAIETIDGEHRKVPKQPSNPARNARSNDGSTWDAFDVALANALERDDLGLGFPCAQPGHPFVFIDVDIPEDDPEGDAWVPSFDRLGGAIVERSPSGTSRRVILTGCEVPEWWRNQAEPGKDTREVKVFTDSGYVTLTGDTVAGFGTPLEATHSQALDRWLRDAWLAFNVFDDETAPWEDTAPDVNMDVNGGASAMTDDEWLDAAHAREALEHIDPDLPNDEWVRIGFALGGHFPNGTARQLFEEWSRGGQKWDAEAESRVPSIIEDADGSVGIGTLIYHAKQGEWDVSAAARAASDGGTVVDDASATTTATAATADGADVTDEDANRSMAERLTALAGQYELDDEKEARHVVHEAALEIVDEYAFVHPPENADAWRSVLYRFNEDEGIYTPDGVRFVEELAERHLGAFLTNTQVNELAGKIKRLSGIDRDVLDTDPHRQVVANGILDLHTGELDEWTPDEYHRTKLDTAWPDDPKSAACPRIDTFFRSLVDERDVPTLYQLVAHSLYKEYVGEKAAMLVGDGENGKSVFLDFVERFLGPDNVSHRSLQQIAENRFAANHLEGQLANFHTDMDGETVRDLGTFKQLTGRDTIDADVKFEKPIAFENYATMIFSANRIPAMDEDTHGLWRRWIYLKFPNEFKRGDEDFIPKDELMRDLITDDELQGLLVRCVEEIGAWNDGRKFFTHIDPPETVRKKMKRASEPMYDFVATCLAIDEDHQLPKEQVRTCYRRYAREEGLPSIDPAQFSRRLLNIRDYPIEAKRSRGGGGGDREQFYQGVRFSPPWPAGARARRRGGWTDRARRRWSDGTAPDVDRRARRAGCAP